MKKLFLFVVLGSSFVGHAQVPQLINYQGRSRHAGEALISEISAIRGSESDLPTNFTNLHES